MSEFHVPEDWPAWKAWVAGVTTIIGPLLLAALFKSCS